MNASTYNIIVSTCMIIALGSAILFDMYSGYDLMLGTIGGIAAITSLGVYLFRHGYFG